MSLPSIGKLDKKKRIIAMCNVQAKIYSFPDFEQGLKGTGQIMIWAASISRECPFKAVIPR